MQLPKSFFFSTAVVFPMTRSRTPGRNMAGESFDSTEDSGVPVLRMDGLSDAADIQGTGLAAGSIVIDKCLSRTFVAAYLLTGNARQAKGMMLESMQQLEIGAIRNGCLSWKAIVAAIPTGDSYPEATPGETSTRLPLELLRVLRLPPLLRQCFVLRVLMAMPRHYCAGLLRIDAQDVDANSCLAARQLASLGAGEVTG
jgi:hypothetical protein